MRTLVRKAEIARADTIFFPEGVARAIHGLDPDLPYFLGGELPHSCLLSSFAGCKAVLAYCQCATRHVQGGYCCAIVSAAVQEGACQPANVWL